MQLNDIQKAELEQLKQETAPTRRETSPELEAILYDPIPVLATSFDGDPVLATASARYREWGEPTVEVEYLYAFYVHADPEDPALHSRLQYGDGIKPAIVVN